MISKYIYTLALISALAYGQSINGVPNQDVTSIPQSNINLPSCVAASNSSSAYACSISPAITALSVGYNYQFQADVANASAPTINFNGLGAIPITTANGGVTTPLSAGMIQPNQWVQMTYDGTNMQMQSTQAFGQITSYGTIATDSAPLGPELTSASNATSTGWTGAYNSYTHTEGNTNPLSFAVGAIIGNEYQAVITISSASAGSISATLGGSPLVVDESSSFSSNGIYTAGPQATATGELVLTPTATFDGTVSVSVKLISPIKTYAFEGTDSTGSASFLVLQTAASLNNIFEGGGGLYNTTGFGNAGHGAGALYRNTTGNYNSAQGISALSSNTTGNYNNAQGAGALFSNSTGSNNSAQGAGALFSNTTGDYNSAQGANALASNTTGYSNAAQGGLALGSNTTGFNNSAQGAAVLSSNTTGFNNSGQGYLALFSNTTGSNNSAQGAGALYSNSTGNSNSAQGNEALFSNTAGYGNATQGQQGLFSNTTGDFNYCGGFECGYRDDTNENYHSITDSQVVFLGALASRDPVVPNTTALTNIACLGYDCKVAANNTVEIGNRVNSAVILNGIATAGGLNTPYLQGTGSAPSVTVSGTGCAVGTPAGTNVAGLIPVTGTGSACTVTITWSASLAYANHSLCGPLQDRTSGALATQATDTTTTATFAPIALTTGDTLQYGACTGY